MKDLFEPVENKRSMRKRKGKRLSESKNVVNLDVTPKAYK